MFNLKKKFILAWIEALKLSNRKNSIVRVKISSGKGTLLS
jgi:hypothetical protein